MAEEQLRTGGGVDEGESMAMAVGGGPRTSDYGRVPIHN
jgi:hypothetical protein